MQALVEKAGDAQVRRIMPQFGTFCLTTCALPDKAGLYPADMTEDEWNALGEQANVVNAMAERQNGKVVMRLNEERYATTLKQVIAHL